MRTVGFAQDSRDSRPLFQAEALRDLNQRDCWAARLCSESGALDAACSARDFDAQPMATDNLSRVRAIATKMPDVEEGTTFGFPAFKVKGKLMAWFPKKKEVEAGSLAVRMSILERDHRILANPKVFYLTPHYRDYTAVLARVEHLSAAALRELLESGYDFVVTKPKRSR